MTQYVLSPLARVSRLDGDGRAVLHAGSGDERVHFAIEGSAAQPMLEWLLERQSPADEIELVDRLSRDAGLDGDDAREFIRGMVDSRVLVPDDALAGERDHIAGWSRFGWRDAADYHLATYGLRFIPDRTDGITYADHFARMIADEHSAGEQPPAHVRRDGTPWGVVAREPAAAVSLGDVLRNAMPINRFEGRPARGSEILPALRIGFGVQRTMGGLLGPHQLRPYPSGGARHPFEMYLVSKGLDDVPVGVYQFDPVAGELVALDEHGHVAAIDDACFGKGGIRSASVVLVLTCRWLRHSWKYRYARSYRMLMLETGHVVQAVTLAMIRNGLNVYHCPSIDDALIGNILALGDDCAEGPVYALGLGHGGAR